jgi:hypothetical protein
LATRLAFRDQRPQRVVRYGVESHCVSQQSLSRHINARHFRLLALASKAAASTSEMVTVVLIGSE